MLAKGRAKILFATITRHAGRWWLSLNVEAADLHPAAGTRPGLTATQVGGLVSI
jgi:putative transposase